MKTYITKLARNNTQRREITNSYRRAVETDDQAFDVGPYQPSNDFWSVVVVYEHRHFDDEVIVTYRDAGIDYIPALIGKPMQVLDYFSL